MATDFLRSWGKLKNVAIPSFQWKTCNRFSTSMFQNHFSLLLFLPSLFHCMHLSSLHLLLYRPPTHTHTAITHRETHTQTQIHNAITHRNTHTHTHTHKCIIKACQFFSFQKVVCKAKEALKRQKLEEKNNSGGQMTKNRPVFQWQLQKDIVSNLYLLEHSHTEYIHTHPAVGQNNVNTSDIILPQNVHSVI